MPQTFRVAVVVALGIVLLAEVGVRLVESRLPTVERWPWPEVQAEHDQMIDLAESGGVEVALVGSSAVRVGWDPSIMDPALGTIYNAGLAGAPVRSTRAWTERIVVPLLQPRVVVVGVAGPELSDANLVGVEHVATFQAAPGLQRAPGGSLLHQVDAGMDRVSALWLHRRTLREPIALIRGTHPQSVDLGPSGEVLEERAFRPIAQVEREMRARAFPGFVLGGDEEQALVDLLRALEQEGVVTVLVAMPFASDAWRVLSPGGDDDCDAFLGTLRRVAQEIGAEFLDLSRVVPDEEFRDPMHVDLDGRARATRALESALQRIDGVIARRPVDARIEP